MAAGDSLNPTHSPLVPQPCLDAPQVERRLDEEIARATRHGTALSCLLVRIDDEQTLFGAHGGELTEQALAYLAAALSRQLRRFDRIGRAGAGELLVLLPGADERRGELVARRALGRLHAIKLEMQGTRRPLPISVGIASFREGLEAQQLLAQARLAARLGASTSADAEADRATR